MRLIDADQLENAIEMLAHDRKTDEIKEYMVLTQVLYCTLHEPVYVNRIKADGTKDYMPGKYLSWNEIAERYVRICKIVREFFGEEFKIEEEPHR